MAVRSIFRRPLLRSARVSILLGLVSAGLPAQGEDANVPELDVAARLEFLEDLSTWQQHLVQPEGKPIDKRIRGVFPVGDGEVFGYLGLGRRASTMQALTGPHYQTSEVWAPKGHFGQLDLDLLEGGAVVPLPGQSLWRVRGCNLVITEDSAGKPGEKAPLSLYTVNFAVPGTRAIHRWIEIRNRGKAPRRLTLRVTWERGSPTGSGKTLHSIYKGKGFEAELLASRPARAEGKILTVDLGEVAPGSASSFALVIRTRRIGDAWSFTGFENPNLDAAIEASRNFWRKRLSRTSTIRSDRKDLADLLEDWKVLMLVQRSEPNGVVAPMINYRGIWIRDSVGPMLAFLRYGLLDDAKAILDFLAAAMIRTGALRNHYPLDLDLGSAKKVWLAGEADWSKVRFPDTELPAWIVLMNEWYYRASWDKDHLKRAWPLLVACSKAMRPDARGTLPTYGDETYLHGAFFSLYPERIGSEAFLPADAPGRRARSLDNSILYMMTLNALGELSEDLDRWREGVLPNKEKWQSRRKVQYEERHVAFLQKLEKAFWMPEEKRFAPFLSPITGRPHRAPFGPVNLKIQWIGYTYALGEKNRQNLKSTLKALWKKGARVGATPTTGYATGSLQGMFLYSLCDLEDRRRNEALDTLCAMAGPAGEWGELYDPQGRPIGAYSEEWPNRLRPWESGINLDAIFFALNGIRYVCSPGWSKKDQRFKLRLPNRSRWLTMKRVVHDGHQFHIFLDEVMKADPKKGSRAQPEPHLRFRIQYERINKDSSGLEYIDSAINVGENVYVRWPNLQLPVNEVAPWPRDRERFLVGKDGPGAYSPILPSIPDGSRNLLLATRRMDSVPPKSFLLDLGRPMLPEQLAGLLLSGIDSGGTPRFRRLVLGLGARSGGRDTFKDRRFWEAPSLRNAFARYREAGGRILVAGFLEGFELCGPFPAEGLEDLDRNHPALEAAKDASKVLGKGWTKVPGGRLDLAALLRKTGAAPASGPYTVFLRLEIELKKARDAILRIGSDDGVRVWWNGEEVLRRKVKRAAAPDQDEILVKLREGRNLAVFQVVNLEGGCALMARLTGLDGLPLVD